MRGFNARVVGVIAAVLMATIVASIGAGAAYADSITGKKYSDAAAYVSDRMHSTPVLSTVSGGVVSLDDCLVVSWSKSSAVSALGENTGRKVLLNVDCNAPVAEAGVPGNSVMTPTGKKYLKWNSYAERIADNPKKYGCYKSDKKLSDCKKICENTRKCDADSL